MAVSKDIHARGKTAALSRCHPQAISAQVSSRSVHASANGESTSDSQPTVR